MNLTNSIRAPISQRVIVPAPTDAQSVDFMQYIPLGVLLQTG
jgi:hypothetical protein